jgi:hypothetical protein
MSKRNDILLIGVLIAGFLIVLAGNKGNVVFCLSRDFVVNGVRLGTYCNGFST